jgi:hypothetical protein
MAATFSPTFIEDDVKSAGVQVSARSEPSSKSQRDVLP